MRLEVIAKRVRGYCLYAPSLWAISPPTETSRRDAGQRFAQQMSEPRARSDCGVDKAPGTVGFGRIPEIQQM